MNSTPISWAQGIDVSHLQGQIQWPHVLRGGVSFAFVKASEGGGFRDPQLGANWRAMGEVGITRGVYHFYRSSARASEQATNLPGAVKAAGGFADTDLPVALDLEAADGASAAKIIASAHDPAGNKILRVDSRNWLTTYAYDPLNRQSGYIYNDGAQATFTYDPVGQRIVMADWTGITSYSYDADGRQQSVAYPTGKALTYGSIRMATERPWLTRTAA